MGSTISCCDRVVCDSGALATSATKPPTCCGWNRDCFSCAGELLDRSGVGAERLSAYWYGPEWLGYAVVSAPVWAESPRRCELDGDHHQFGS